MADVKKPSIANSVSYTIGGKEYSAKDVSRLKPSQTGSAKTGSDITSESAQKVKSQTDAFHKTDSGIVKSGIQSEVSTTPRTVEGIKTGAETPINQVQHKPQVQPSPSIHPQSPKNQGHSESAIPSTPNKVSDGVKTQSTMTHEAAGKVQSQTDAYHKTGAYDTGAKGIQSEVSKAPRAVEGVKTGVSAMPEQGRTYKPQIGGTSPSGGSTPYVATGNVKTQSTMTHEAAGKVQSQTDAYHKTGAYDKKEPVISDRVNKAPTNISGVQTGTVRMPRGSAASFFDAVNSTRDKRINLASAATMMGGKAQSALSGQNDLGTQAAGMGVGAGLAGAQVFKATQTATAVAPALAKNAVGSLYGAGKGLYQVGLTGGLATVAVSRTAAFIQAGQFHPLSHASMQMLKAQALSVGLNNTAVAQGIIHSVTGIHNKIQSGIQTAKYIGNKVQTGYHVVQNGIKVVRGVTTGTISVGVAAHAVSRMANKAVNLGAAGIKTGAAIGLKTGKGLIVKGVTRGIPFVTFRGIPKTARFLHRGISPLAGFMQNTDDWAIRGTGNAITATDIGLRTAVQGVKATGYTVRTAVKGGTAAGRATLAAGKFIKNNGLKAAWNAGRRKAFKTAVKGGKSLVSAVINLVKTLGRKALVPLLVIVLIVMGFNGIVMVPVTSVSSIFSSMFSTKDSQKDYDVREYLNTIVPGLSTNFQQDLANRMQDSWSTYNIVRFYSNTGTDDVVEPTLAGISSVFPTNDELLNMIQPIFNAVVLMKYDLEPTEAEAQALTEEIFSKLFTVTTETSVEYCGQDIKTGEGTPNQPHSCGSIHALSDCPNKITGTHGSYTCDDCCYYDCPGHSRPNGRTYHCSGCVHHCSGYTYCGSHSVIAYKLSVDGIYRLEAEYFLDPIEQLSNLPSRTDEQETKLQELKDYHEIFQEMMSQVSINYGGGMTMADLSGVVFINGTRTGNQAVIDLALSQVGQTGGQPYWSYYGFSSRVEWCACFVHWCMRNTPSASGNYPTTSNNAYCQTVANNFKSMGQWGDRGYTNIVAGDTIFFDWQGDGHTDHIGLVIGTDGTNVYTVEGNSGDAVKVKSYPVGSSVIYGYGLMNY